MPSPNPKEYARQWRAKIKSNPIKYAKYLEKTRAWGKVARAKRTPEQKAKYRKRINDWRDNNRKQYRETQKKYRRNLRQKVISFYGGKCSCCGEKRNEFLCIDHIGGGGNKHRKEIGGYGFAVYKWLRKQKFPKGFRILCHNCNMSLGLYGYCPHIISP